MFMFLCSAKFVLILSSCLSRCCSTSKKSEATVKSWKPESETKRKESVIKNIGNTKGIVENGNMNHELYWKRHADGQVNGSQKLSKPDYPRDEDKGMQRNNASKFSSSRTEERASRISSPNVSRGADVTVRTSERSLHSSLVSSSASRSNPKSGMTLDQSTSRHPRGPPYYTYSSPMSRTSYDTVVSHSAAQHGDKRTADLDNRVKDKGMEREMPKDVTRIKSIRRSEEGRGDLRINGVKEGRSKTKGNEERGSERDYFQREPRKCRRYLERKSDRGMRDEREERSLKYCEELTGVKSKRDRLLSSPEKKRREQNDGESGYTSGYREIQENREKSNGPTLAKSGYSVSYPVDLHSSKISEQKQVNLAKSASAEHRAEDKMDNSWNPRLGGRKDVGIGSEKSDIKKTDRFNIPVVKIRENGPHDVPPSSEKDRYDDIRPTEMERLRYRHFNDLSHERASFFDHRFVNTAMFDHRGFDPRIIGPNVDSRYTVDSRTFDSRFSESNLPGKALEKRKERVLHEPGAEKRNANDRKEDRNGKEEKRMETNGRLRIEQLRLLRDGDDRSRGSSGSVGRSISPRCSEVDKFKTREDREVKSASEVSNRERSKKIDGSKVYKNSTRDPSGSPGQSDRSRRRSPVTSRPREEKSNGSDMNGQKSNSNSETTRASDLRTGTGNGTPMTGSNFSGSGFIMAPAAAGYQDLPVMNTEAHPFLQQILQAQNEGRIPMVLMPQAGVFPPTMADSANTALYTNEYLTALWCVASELQGINHGIYYVI